MVWPVRSRQVSKVSMSSGAEPEVAKREINALDVSGYPEKYQTLYKTFEVRCSKCHPLSRPLNARLRPEAWKKYVKKMISRK